MLTQHIANLHAGEGQAFFVSRPIAVSTPYTNAASETAIPPTNPKIANPFQTVECVDTAASQILTPHSAAIRHPSRIWVSAAVTASTAPYTVICGGNWCGI